GVAGSVTRRVADAVTIAQAVLERSSRGDGEVVREAREAGVEVGPVRARGRIGQRHLEAELLREAGKCRIVGTEGVAADARVGDGRAAGQGPRLRRGRRRYAGRV